MYIYVVNKMGHEGMTVTSELLAYGKSFFGPEFLGVFAQDKLPEKIYTREQTYKAIINVDTTGMPGTHWVGVTGLKNSSRIMVYDSFGRHTVDLLKILSRQAEKHGGAIDTEYDAEQRKIQNSCGQFTLAWFHFLDMFGEENARRV